MKKSWIPEQEPEQVHNYNMKKDMRDGWTKDKIANICTFFGDGDWIESKDQSEEGIRLIQTGNIGNGYYIDKEDKPHYISEDTFNKLNCTEIVEGDCLISRLPRPLGRSCLVPKLKSKAITAVDCTILRFKDFCLPEYFVYFTQSPLYNLAVSQDSTGSTRKRISRKNLGSIEIPLPPLTTQQQIVSELDLLTHILDQKRQQLKEYDALAESIFYDMFGDPVENPKGWEVKTISEIVTKDKNSIKRGPFGGALKKEIFVESGYLVYEQYHALNNDYSYERYYITEEKFQEMKDFSVKGGDIIISCSGVNLGRLSIIPENCKPGIINQALLKLSLDKTLYSSVFFAYVFSSASFKEKYFGYNRGCAIPNLPPMSEFKRIKFISPPLPLQQTFAAKIQSIEHQKQLLKESIKETEMLFQSRMDYWFNG